jgi:hypothetical protein
MRICVAASSVVFVRSYSNALGSPSPPFPVGRFRDQGSEVFNSYGRRTNGHLLLDYGFALPDNEHDTYPLSVRRRLTAFPLAPRGPQGRVYTLSGLESDWPIATSCSSHVRRDVACRAVAWHRVAWL